MSPKSTTPAGIGGRRHSIFTHSVMRAVIKHSFAAAMIVAVCVASEAIAAVTLDEFAGRWLSKKQKLTLDVSRCGNGWCGVEVTEAGACGRTVLRLNVGESGNDRVRFSGRLQLAAESEPYGIQSILQRRGGALVLTIRGHTGGKFQFVRRTFDFDAVFARVDDPICRPDAKVS